jgi:hypothetical protein
MKHAEVVNATIEIRVIGPIALPEIVANPGNSWRVIITYIRPCHIPVQIYCPNTRRIQRPHHVIPLITVDVVDDIERLALRLASVVDTQEESVIVDAHDDVVSGFAIAQVDDTRPVAVTGGLEPASEGETATASSECGDGHVLTRTGG